MTYKIETLHEDDVVTLSRHDDMAAGISFYYTHVVNVDGSITDNIIATKLFEPVKTESSSNDQPA